MSAEGWGTLVQPRKKRGLPLAAAEDEEEPGGGEGCQCQTLIVAVCQTLGQQVKQHIDSLQRMKNRMNPETFTGFVTNQPTSLLLPLLVGPPLLGGGDKMQSWNWPVPTSGVIFQPIWGRKL